ncbi:MAG TPA: hypothetical protein VHQ47_16965 [Phycisphaerae bacterium]|nr:hypothetical protein [Phycisphaerae bacterium]
MNRAQALFCGGAVAWAAWGMVAASPVVLGGCEQQLFKDSPRARNNIDKYYDEDSAVETTESRRHASEMGFGFPTGPGGE